MNLSPNAMSILRANMGGGGSFMPNAPGTRPILPQFPKPMGGPRLLGPPIQAEGSGQSIDPGAVGIPNNNGGGRPGPSVPLSQWQVITMPGGQQWHMPPGIAQLLQTGFGRS